MMYPYLNLSDGTEVLHSHIIEADGLQKVEVHFERPNDDGFDEARCELPGYIWVTAKGFNNDEISFFEKFLASNAHLIYRYAKSGGVNIA